MKNNPFKHETPEWQLWENGQGAAQLARAYTIDIERYMAKRAEATAKEKAFAEALRKLRPDCILWE